jgi:hypothetical protein
MTDFRTGKVRSFEIEIGRPNRTMTSFILGMIDLLPIPYFLFPVFCFNRSTTLGGTSAVTSPPS